MDEGAQQPGGPDATLAVSADDIRAVIDRTVGFVGLLAPDGTLREANATVLKAGGLRRDEVIGRKIWNTWWWSHDAGESRKLEAAVARAAAGETVRYDIRVRMAGGALTDIDFMLSPLRDAQGKVTAIVPSGYDITQRKAAEDRLRAAHDTFRHLVERSPFGLYTVDADFRLAQVSDGAQKVFENVRPLHGRDFAEVLRLLWPEPFATEAIGRFRHTLATGEPYRSPTTVEVRADIGETEAYDWKIERLQMPDGRNGVVCHFYDLSERQRYEERIRTLMREVNHRSKNMLALVLSIARQTVASSVEDFRDRFTQRIQGLSVGQDLLVQSDWQFVPLEALLRGQLAHFGDLIGTRILLDGPALEISPAAAQALGLAVHELGTNAAKYGALSGAEGRVEIRWWTSHGDAAQEFSLEWVESGGPAVASPRHMGFGSAVTGSLVRTSLNARVATDYAVSGLTWRLICPAERVLEQPGTDTRQVEPAGDPAPPLDTRRKRVLVVDDEALIALEVAAALEEAGYEVIGPARSVAQAMALIRDHGCDAAVLDVNLGRESSAPVAQRLEAVGVPFLTLSGYSQSQLPQAFRSGRYLGKPLGPAQLRDALDRLMLGA
jgi:PAS domain S-box-containing protein